ncbi:MAG: ParB/RepB/Spo0J family partition protein [Deltaproteobacteria bacterium]|jgi:ParB family chromosome partitioning protein|nr:ParB/RepB/Spo0J family partition protein [Deltaproteobacteria bacterium]
MPSVRDKLARKESKLDKRKKKTNVGAPTSSPHPAVLDNYEEGDFYNVPIHEIKANPDQPRQYFDEESLAELAESIRQKGVLQPVIVRIDEDRSVYLVAGERRLRAAREAGLDQIPAILTKGNPAEIALIENLQRENLKPVEEAEAFAHMIQEYSYTQEQLSTVVGKARTTITETLGLNRLPEEVKEECRRADIYPRRLLVEIAKQKTTKNMVALFNSVKEGNLKSDQVRKIARKPQKRSMRTPAAIISDRANQLCQSLEKLNLDTVEETEKLRLVRVLQDMKGLIDRFLD